MAIPISKLDRFKVETEFGDGYVVHTAYEWEFSSRKSKGSSTWWEVKEIGAGAFGSVWLEKEEPGGKLRAVKRLQRSSMAKTGFSQELLALITLTDHKHLFVEFIGWYENTRDVFIAMEYIEYGDLSEYMKDRETAKAEASEVTRQILEGLKILHGEGICHRDLKPQNILVASRDPIWVKIADFGASKRTNNTLLRTLCGTRAYLAPEIQGLLPRRFKTGLEFTHALDMWSLGCIVHELLTSEIPFLEHAQEAEFDDMTGLETCFADIATEVDMETLYEYCQGGIEFPTESLRTMSPITEDGIEFITSMLAPNPRDRVTVATALENPWVANPGYTSPWYNDFLSEFSGLGIQLNIEQASIKQLRSKDIALVLPSTTNLVALLGRALAGGYYVAASSLLESSSPQLVDPSVTQHLIKREASNGRLSSVKLLLSTAKNIDLADFALLFVAVKGGWAGIVQLLLEYKVDPNHDIDGRTAMQEAAETGNLDIVKLLLQHNADPNFHINGQTILRAAVEQKNFELVATVLDSGVDVNGQCNNGWTALQAASGRGYRDVVQQLLDNKADVNASASAYAGLTALQAAAGGGHLDVVQFLLDNKADVNASASAYAGLTALQAAAGGGHLDVVQLLLDNNADVNARACISWGQTALQAAAGGGHLNVVQLLLDNKADVNASASAYAGLTALQAAASGGYLNVAQLLLEHKADVNGRASAYVGLTGLEAAAAGGDINIMKLLWGEMGSQSRDVSEDWSKGLEMAVKRRHSVLVEFLLECGFDLNDKLALALTSAGYRDLVTQCRGHA